MKHTLFLLLVCFLILEGLSGLSDRSSRGLGWDLLVLVLIVSSFEVISQRCRVGCVGGRVVCACELINLRCVFVGMCIRGGGGVLGAGSRLCGVLGEFG